MRHRSKGVVLGKAYGIKVTIPHQDRMKHAHVIGATGSGKTTLLANMVKQDMEALHMGESMYGVGVIDPKGDLIVRVLQYVPEHREKDVILFDPSDTAKPLGFNVLEDVPEDLRSLTASQVVVTFKKLFGKLSWGPRLEHILRFTILTLLEIPGSTLLDIPRLLMDEEFRRGVLPHVSNFQVVDFWNNEYSHYASRRGMSSVISPILNKIGPWVAYPEVRNVVGQIQSSFNVRQVMDQKKIFLARLPEGILGEDVRQILGALLITRFQLAATSRVKVPEQQRQRFLLYVDEFQNFVTDSSDKIITEGRSFKLGMVMANQHDEQLRGQRGLYESIKKTVSAKIIMYKEGRKFKLQYIRPQDIKDMMAEPFSIVLNPLRPNPQISDGEHLIKESRNRFGRDRDWVEGDIRRRRGFKTENDFYESEKL